MKNLIIDLDTKQVRETTLSMEEVEVAEQAKADALRMCGRSEQPSEQNSDEYETLVNEVKAIHIALGADDETIDSISVEVALLIKVAAEGLEMSLYDFIKGLRDNDGKCVSAFQFATLAAVVTILDHKEE